jgi:murein L,D-transpeptidase YcbB/YkuD
MDRKEVQVIDNALIILGYLRLADVSDSLPEHIKRVYRRAAIETFQLDHDLRVDGVCGGYTRAKLNEEVARKTR